MFGDTKVQKNYENKECEQSVRTLAFAFDPLTSRDMSGY